MLCKSSLAAQKRPTVYKNIITFNNSTITAKKRSCHLLNQTINCQVQLSHEAEPGHPCSILEWRRQVRTHLIACWLELDPGAGPDDDEGVEEVGLDAGGREGRVVCLQEHHADNVVADVPFPLELLVREASNVRLWGVTWRWGQHTIKTSKLYHLQERNTLHPTVSEAAWRNVILWRKKTSSVRL